MNDVDWLLSFEPFGGHVFDRLKEFGLDRCATILRTATARDEFTDPIIDSVVAEYRCMEERHTRARAGYAGAHELDKSLWEIKIALWSGPRAFAVRVESILWDALWSIECFDEIPKRSPAEHRKHYQKIEELAKSLSDLIGHDGSFGDFFRDYSEVKDSLAEIAISANRTALAAPLSRPNAKNARRTYVAKDLSKAFKFHTGSQRHAAAATLLNILFPNDEPVDAVYMQSIARSGDLDLAAE